MRGALLSSSGISPPPNRLAAQYAAYMTANRVDVREEIRRLLQWHDSERRRLAAALHGSVAQSIAALQTNLDLIERAVPSLDARARELLTESRALVRDCFKDARTIADELSPRIVAAFGLAIAVECRLAAFREQSGIRVVYHCDNVPRLDHDLECALFSMVESALPEFTRSMKGITPSVSLTSRNQLVELSIEPAAGDLVINSRWRMRLRFANTRIKVTHRPARPWLLGSGDTDVVLLVTVPAATQ